MFSISTLLKSILLSAILIVAFWIRIQSTTAIPEGHFTGVDAYTYYFQRCYYVPPIAWDNFAIRLFLRGIPSDAFVPVHTNAKMGATAVKVWEIHYPPDIKPNPKYLKTGVSEIDAQLQLQ